MKNNELLKKYAGISTRIRYFNINVDDAIYEVLTMPREEITI